MARTRRPKRVARYPDEFKLKAVRLSALEGVKIQDVAEILEIHPFMLSRWRRELLPTIARGGAGAKAAPRPRRSATPAAAPARRARKARS